MRHLLKTGPVVLFFDGHVSHLALDLLKEARSESVPPVEYDTRLATTGCGCLRASENGMEESVARVQDRDKSLKC